MDNFKKSYLEQNNLYMKVNYINKEEIDNNKDTIQDIFSYDETDKTINTTLKFNENEQKEKIDDKTSVKISKYNDIISKHKIKKINFELDSENLGNKINLKNSFLDTSKDISEKKKKFDHFSEYQKKKYL